MDFKWIPIASEGDEDLEQIPSYTRIAIWYDGVPWLAFYTGGDDGYWWGYTTNRSINSPISLAHSKIRPTHWSHIPKPDTGE